MIIKNQSQITRFLDNSSHKVALFHGTDTGLALSYAKRFAGNQYRPMEGDEAVMEAVLCVDMFNPPSGIVVKSPKKLDQKSLDKLVTGEQPLKVALVAGRLTPADKLRKLCEASPKAASIGCYPLEGANLSAAVAAFLKQNGATKTDGDALAFLTATLPQDWGICEAELTKLLIYTQHITLKAAQECLMAQKSLTLNELADALGMGDTQKAHKTLESLLADGVELVAITRTVANHFCALTRALMLEKQRMPLPQILMSLDPPVFFQRKQTFTAQMRRFTTARSAHKTFATLKLEAVAKSGKLGSQTRALTHLIDPTL